MDIFLLPIIVIVLGILLTLFFKFVSVGKKQDSSIMDLNNQTNDQINNQRDINNTANMNDTVVQSIEFQNQMQHDAAATQNINN